MLKIELHFYICIYIQLKTVLDEIEGRSSRKEYREVLVDCHRMYCEQRLSLVCIIIKFSLFIGTILTKDVLIIFMDLDKRPCTTARF